MKIQPRDINLFGIGQIVTIPNIAEFKKTKILAINDSGVSVSSNGYPHTIVSGKSPAIPYVDENNIVTLTREQQEAKIALETMKNKEDNKYIVPATEETKKLANEMCGIGGRAKRGSLTAKMENLQFFPPDKKFTVAEFAELNGIPVNYANSYIKEAVNNKTMVEAGKADKKPGQRGKVATLYQ